MISLHHIVGSVGTCALLVLAQPTVAQYRGGAGDGHDAASVAAATLAGANTSLLFGGGAGDGHDATTASALLLDGADVAALFGGGPGDGHDVAFFSGGSVPVPVELITLTATAYPEHVLVEWTTAHAPGTNRFAVEVSASTQDFENVGEVGIDEHVAGGDTERAYRFRDSAPLPGQRYYRLRTIDEDGSVYVSELVAVRYGEVPTDWDFLLYPTPNAGRALSLRPEGFADGGDFGIDIVDAMGRRVYRAVGRYADEDHRMDFLQALPVGTYLVTVTRGGERGSKVLVVRGE